MLEVKFTNNQQNVKTKQIKHRTCKIFLKETSLIYLTHKNESGWFIGESWMLCFLPCEQTEKHFVIVQVEMNEDVRKYTIIFRGIIYFLKSNTKI